MPKAKKYPYSYDTTRKIRGEYRKVKVTKTSRKDESLKFLKPKTRKRDQRIISTPQIG